MVFTELSPKDWQFLNLANTKKDEPELVRLEPPTSADWKLFAELLQFFEPFRLATLETNGEKNSTLSLIVPWYNIILDHCEEKRVLLLSNKQDLYKLRRDGIDIAEDDALSEVTQICMTWLNLVFEKIRKYFNISSDYCIFAVLLDPRHKSRFYEDCNKDLEWNQKEKAKVEKQLKGKQFLSQQTILI